MGGIVLPVLDTHGIWEYEFASKSENAIARITSEIARVMRERFGRPKFIVMDRNIYEALCLEAMVPGSAPGRDTMLTEVLGCQIIVVDAPNFLQGVYDPAYEFGSKLRRPEEAK